MNKKIEKIKVVNQLRKAVNLLEKSFEIYDSNLIHHEINLKQAISQQAYNFAYKDYEVFYESSRKELENAADQLKILESKQYLLSGALKKTAELLLKKVNKGLQERLAIQKIAKKDVG